VSFTPTAADRDAYDQVGKDIEVLDRTFKHLDFEFRRGHGEQVAEYKSRLILLVKIVERDVRLLPDPPRSPQPVRLDGDAMGGDTAA
jgi:hypothetical protein